MGMHEDFKNNLTQASFGVIKGARETKEQLKSALLMDRHVILVGPPGVGKTTLAKDIVGLLPKRKLNDCPYHCDPSQPLCPECRSKKTAPADVDPEDLFVRVQGSPDLTAEDLIGDIDPAKALKFGPLSVEAFTPGKLFRANNGILFFDEINRCSEKLQNALLQVLEEQRITVGSYQVDFPAQFIFIGTMNPEDTSTEPLSDVFLDRFDLVPVAYPDTLEIEKEIVKEKGKHLVTVPDHLVTYFVKFIRGLREHPHIEKKPSVRATIGIFERAQSRAQLQNQPEVRLEDVKAVMHSVLSHRIRLKPSVKYLESPQQFVQEEFDKFVQKEGEVP